MQTYSAKEASSYANTRTTWPEVTAFFLKYVNSPNFLDAGCGTGNDLYTIHQQKGFYGYGCDNSEAMLEQAKRKVPGATLVVADLEKQFPFDRQFDVIFMHDVIHHLKNPEFFIQQAYAHLNPQGILIVGSEFTEGLKTKYIMEYFPSAYAIDAKRYHSLQKISQTLTSTGFSLVETLELSPERPFTTEVLEQVRTRSHSVLLQLDEAEYKKGLSRVERDFEQGKLITIKNEYTLLACQKP